MSEPESRNGGSGTPAAPEISRRRALERLSVAAGAVGAGIVALPAAGFVVAPLLEKVPEAWRPVGRPDEFKVGETASVTIEEPSALPWAGVTARTAAWLRREDAGHFVAFAINCTHLGCPVRWLESARLFMCPCHGGVYYSDGTVAAGPPPRPLQRYAVRIHEGRVEIRTAPLFIS